MFVFAVSWILVKIKWRSVPAGERRGARWEQAPARRARAGSLLPCVRVRTESVSLRFGVDSGELQEGKIPTQCRDTVNFTGKTPQMWQNRPIPVRSITQGRKSLARFLMVIQAWMKPCSQSAKGANGYSFCQDPCYWKMTQQRQPDLGTAFDETKGSWVPIVDLGVPL